MNNLTTLNFLAKENLAELFGLVSQITEKLVNLYKTGTSPKTFNPASILLNLNKTVISIEEQSVNSHELECQWRFPNLKKNITEKDDVFTLGCIIYYILTFGLHPFGKSTYRQLFIQYNLYYLEDVEDKNIQFIIQTMIHQNLKNRPKLNDLNSLHPIFWNEKTITTYLINMAKNVPIINSGKLDENVFVTCDDKAINKFGMVLTTSEIFSLILLEQSQTGVFYIHKTFPEFLLTIFNNSTNRVVNLQDSLMVNVLIIAKKALQNKIKRYHGRLGYQYVHVLKSQSNINTLKTLRYLNHPNLLRVVYMIENKAIAVEPFQFTLKTWLKNKTIFNTIDLITIKNIMLQIIKGLSYLHENEIIHGELCVNQIIIFPSIPMAKIGKFSFKPYELTNNSKSKDVQQLGQIFKFLLKKNLNDLSNHLIYSINNFCEELIPPIYAVPYHPFFWSNQEIKKFLLMSKEFKNKINFKAENILSCWLQLQTFKNEENVELYYCYNYNYVNLT